MDVLNEAPPNTRIACGNQDGNVMATYRFLNVTAYANRRPFAVHCAYSCQAIDTITASSGRFLCVSYGRYLVQAREFFSRPDVTRCMTRLSTSLFASRRTCAAPDARSCEQVGVSTFIATISSSRRQQRARASSNFYKTTSEESIHACAVPTT